MDEGGRKEGEGWGDRESRGNGRSPQGDWSFPGRRAGGGGRRGRRETRGGGGGQGRAATIRGGVQAADRARGGPLHQAGRDRRAASARGAVLLAPGDLARGSRPR